VTQRGRSHRSLGQRFDRWLLRTFVIGPPHRTPPPPRPVPDEPTAPPIPLPARVAIHAFSVAIPVAAAALLIPLRESIAPSTAALILVLPVVLVALTGSATAGALSAIAAALAFDIFHTRPYYSLTIDAADDVESALVLGLIALIVATVVTREVESRTRSSSRRHELAAVDAVAHAVAHADANRLIEVVTGTIADLLDARTCRWSPGFHGTIGPVLNRTGTFAGAAGPTLPAAGLEIPVVYQREELGRLIVRGDSTEPISAEERHTLITIADLFAAGLTLHQQGSQ
jgi:hypothetical protein